MSSERVPSRAEVMGWSPQQLADYLRRVRCASVFCVFFLCRFHAPRQETKRKADREKKER